jgi:hypothetical protein
MSNAIADRLDEPGPKKCQRMARELYVMAETMKSGEARTRTLMRAKFWDDKAGTPGT